MDLETVTADVRTEIEVLHREFEDWFHDRSTSLERVEQALAPDFLFVAPSGAILSRDQVLAGLRGAKGSARVTIAVANVAVHWQRGDLTAASYEEHQTGGEVTTNRQSTVVFERDTAAPGGLRWLSVHETWLVPPPD